MNHPVAPGMVNSTFNSNQSFSSMPNLSYPHAPFNTQFAQFDPLNRSPNRYPNPNSKAPFPPSFISPLASNNNHGARSVPSVFSSSSDSFTFAPQNNLETLKKLDLGEAIRGFKQLISHAETTVKQLADLVKLNLSDCSKQLSVCPFDSSHRMPPENLFRHSLCCPSSPGVVGLDILSTVRYPKTLRSEKDLSAQSQMQLIKPLPGSALDICIAIEEEEGLLGSDFFYKDAPGVVSSTQGDTKKTFSLPNILYMECVDSENENAWLTENCNVSLLPSEFLALRTELTSSNDFPSRYCFVTLVAAMGLGKIMESEIIYWIILNSPAFGIIIDLPMARHIALLSKLCLKAISHEAFGIYQKEIKVKGVGQNHDGNDINTNNTFYSLQTSYFNCPVLLESVTWLASEMSTLYGQACGRSIVIGMLQHSFVCAGKAVSYPVVGKLQTITKILDLTEVSSAVHNSDAKENATKDGTSKTIVEKNLPKSSCIMSSEVASGDACQHGDGLISESKVFVSQVSAAVAALLERFLLEERIKGHWHLRRLSKFQLFAEHDVAVKKAAEEREKRMNYKPILEHDGLVWQRSYQDSKKHKTREQLLAEERDYKRRRMSYRGKKVKRTPTQVLHDIIEGHMEEIRLAGGIGCFIKGASETPQIATGSIHLDSVGQNIQELRNPDSFGERSSFRRHYPMTFHNRPNSSKGLVGEMDMRTTEFDDGNRPKNCKRNDYDQDYGNDEQYNAKLSHGDDFYHYSGHSSEKKQGHETRHHSRSIYRSPDIYGERNSRAHCEDENRHRSRSQEHEHKSGHRNRSREHKHESGHISRSLESKHESRHRSRSLERQHESRHRSRSLERQHESRHRSRSLERQNESRHRGRSRDRKHEKRHRRSVERKRSDSNDFERWQLT